MKKNTKAKTKTAPLPVRKPAVCTITMQVTPEGKVEVETTAEGFVSAFECMGCLEQVKANIIARQLLTGNAVKKS